jgi:hypothetical protein
MAALISLSIDLSKIDKSKIIQGKNGGKYLDLTINIDDKVNNYGQNVSAWHGQSKEEREAKANRDYLGNGKVVWENGTITKAEPQQPQQAAPAQQDLDLPF